MKKNKIIAFDIIVFLFSISLITFSIYQFNIKQPYNFAIFLTLLLSTGLLLVFEFINKNFGTVASKPIMLIANILIVLSIRRTKPTLKNNCRKIQLSWRKL